MRDREGILKEGLKPQDNPDYTPGVYAMNTKEGLEHYVGDSRRNSDIYKVHVPIHKQESDPNMPGAFFTREAVPPTHIEKVGNTTPTGDVKWHK